jgi:hypothetical protein
MLDEEGALEPGGVKLNVDKEDWFGQAMEHALAISEDEPTLKQALDSDKHSAGLDVIEVELTQLQYDPSQESNNSFTYIQRNQLTAS